MAGYKEISPTFISTAAITPGQLDRITIPYNGYQPYYVDPLEGNKWGSGVSGYSGLGPLTYHGNTYVRDLPVGRTHRHYNSGVFQSDYRNQPQRWTQLRRADCRMNEQLLPKPLDFPFDPIATNPALLIKGRDPWYPFRSINEVVPLDQLDRVDHCGRYVLSDVTRQTLTNYYHHLHGVPRHQDVYPNHYRPPPSDQWNPTQQAPPVYSQPQPFLPEYCNKPYMLPQQSPSTTDLLCCDGQWRRQQISSLNHCGNACRSKSDSALNCLVDTSKAYNESVANQRSGTIPSTTASSTHSNFRATESNITMPPKYPVEFSGVGQWGPEIQRLMSRICEIYGPNVLDQLMHSPDFPSNAYTMLAQYEIGRVPREITNATRCAARPTKARPRPIWPPGPTYTINTKTMQIQERAQLNTNLWSDGPPQQPTTNFAGIDKVNNLRRPFECPFNIRKSSYTPSRSYYDQPDASNCFTQHKLTQPRYEPDCMDTNVTPLQSYLHPTGNRVTDRLGLPFKAVAQRRYHALHTEHVPDLRENHRTSKKYHFKGLHGAAAFRGQCTGIPVDSQLGYPLGPDLLNHGQCSAPLEKFCAMQRTQLPQAYKDPREKNRQMYRWNECFIERAV